jgi:TPR repeat protein
MKSLAEIVSLAEGGLAEAQYRLGNAYRLGDGVPRDDLLALKWYRRAAEQEHSYAIKCMENACRNGLGVKKDPIEADRWRIKNLREKAEAPESLSIPEDPMLTAVMSFTLLNQGDAESLYRIGVCYEEGVGLLQDRVRAAAFFIIGKDNDEVSARSTFRLRCIESMMSIKERNLSLRMSVRLRKEIKAGQAKP